MYVSHVVRVDNFSAPVLAVGFMLLQGTVDDKAEVESKAEPQEALDCRRESFGKEKLHHRSGPQETTTEKY